MLLPTIYIHLRCARLFTVGHTVGSRHGRHTSHCYRDERRYIASSLPARSSGPSHARRSHPRLAGHDAASFGRARTRLVVLLQLVALKCLLILDLLLRVFVPLQDLVVLLFALLQVLIHLIFESLSERVHLSLLLLHELGLGSQDLLVAVFHVLLALALFKLIGLLLHLMRVLIILLLGQVRLNFALIQQLC